MLDQSKIKSNHMVFFILNVFQQSKVSVFPPPFFGITDTQLKFPCTFLSPWNIEEKLNKSVNP